MLSRSEAARNQRGASLIEVLIAALLLATGMLAMAWLHTASLRYDKMAQFRGVAIQLANGLADRMRANAAAAGDYARLEGYAPDTESIVVTDCATVLCTAAELADYDVAALRNASRTLLPAGDLLIEIPAAGQAVIWVLWRDPEAIDTDDSVVSLAGRCPAAVGSPVPMPQCLPIQVLI